MKIQTKKSMTIFLEDEKEIEMLDALVSLGKERLKELSTVISDEEMVNIKGGLFNIMDLIHNANSIIDLLSSEGV